MENKKYYSAIWVLAALGLWSSCITSDGKVATPPRPLPVELKSEVFMIPDSVSTDIGKYQFTNGNFYFNAAIPEEIEVYKINIIEGSASVLFRLTSKIQPFDIDPTDFGFYVNLEKNGAETIEIIERGRSFHLFTSDRYISSVSVPENEGSCLLNNVVRQIPVHFLGNDRFALSSCYFSQEDPEIFKRAYNVFRLPDPLNNDAVFGVLFPPEYHDRVLPINALVETTINSMNENLFINFSVSSNIYRYDSLLKPKSAVRISSGAFDGIKAANSEIIKDPYEEMIHYFQNGHYPHMILVDEYDLLIRFARWLDPSFVNVPYRNQHERISKMRDYLNHSMILYNFKSDRHIGEYILDHSGLSVDVAFFYDNSIYIHDSEGFHEEDNALVFVKIPIETLLLGENK